MQGFELLNWELYGNSLEAWLITLAFAIFLFALLRWGLGFVRSRVEQFSKRTENQLDDVFVRLLESIPTLSLLAVSLVVAARFLSLPPEGSEIVRGLGVIALFFQAGLWGNQLVSFWLNRYSGDRDGQLQAAALGALGFLAQLLLWSLIVLLALANLGFDVTALVASLGIGGVAVGLAVQNILGDLFASLSIVFDKPFRVGDFIMVDSDLGAVEYIGLKTTRVKSLSGEQLVFANSDLVKSRIHNFGKMQERRVAFKIGVTYQTTHEQLQLIPSIAREAIEAQKSSRFDRAHFQGFGDFSLDFEIVYYVIGADYNLYMDIQQAINLALVRRFAEEGIEFARPTQSLFIQRVPAASTAD